MIRRSVAIVVLLVACAEEGRPPPDTGAAPFRRLTRGEYNNTVRDLLGVSIRPADTFPPEEQAHGFSNNSEVLGVTQVLAENYLVAAEQLADEVTANVAEFVGCDPADGVACAMEFIEEFGLRAFRRPLEAEEIMRLADLFTTGVEAKDFQTGIQMVVTAMLQSPHFLYRVELGEPPAPGERLGRPTAWETASRLSYLLWGSLPDEELFAAAEAGVLSTA